MRRKSYYKAAGIVRWLGEAYTCLMTYTGIELLTNDPKLGIAGVFAVLLLSVAVDTLEPTDWSGGVWHWTVALIILWLFLAMIEATCALTLTDTVRINLGKICGCMVDRGTAVAGVFLAAFSVEVILRILIPRGHARRRTTRRPA